MNKEATIRAGNNTKIGSSGELIGGGGYSRHVINRCIIVAHLGKTYSPGLDGLSEREEQKGDPKGD
jgi:hypothetical protein